MRGTSGPGPARILIAVVFGFFVYAATMALGIALCMAMAGVDGVFEEGSWRVSTGAAVVGILVAALGGFFGGSLCRLIAGSARVSVMFAVMICAMLFVQGGIRSSATDPNAVRAPGAQEPGTIAQHMHPGSLATVGIPLAAAVAALVGGAAAGRARRLLTGGGRAAPPDSPAA
jgi:hypothetical protein